MDSVVVRISASYASDNGSIPGHGRHSIYYFAIAIHIFYRNIYFYFLTTLINNTNYNSIQQ